MYFFLTGLVGGIVGTVLYDTLTAVGLHWLTWPVTGLLFLSIVVLVLRKSRLRKRC